MDTPCTQRRYDLDLLDRDPGCPGIASGDPPFGDVNCDGLVNELDSLAILAFLAGIPYDVVFQLCVGIGEELQPSGD